MARVIHSGPALGRSASALSELRLPWQGQVTQHGFTLREQGRSTLSEFGPLWGTKSTQRVRDLHASVRLLPAGSRTRANPHERLASRPSRGGLSLPGSSRDARDGPTPAAGARTLSVPGHRDTDLASNLAEDPHHFAKHS